MFSELNDLRFTREAELETLLLDTINPVRLISIFTLDTFDFLLNSLFWISLLGSLWWELYHWLRIIICLASDWLLGFCQRHWLKFRQFPGYQIKIKLICRLTKKSRLSLVLVSSSEYDMIIDSSVKIFSSLVYLYLWKLIVENRIKEKNERYQYKLRPHKRRILQRSDSTNVGLTNVGLQYKRRTGTNVGLRQTSD